MSLSAADIEKLVTRGQQLYAEGQLDAAAQILEEVLAIDPIHPRALFNKGVLSYVRGQHDIAEDFYHRATLAKAGYKEAHYNLGVILQKAGRAAEARAQFENAIAADPAFFEALMGMGAVQRELHAYDKSIEYFLRASAIRTNEQVYNHIGYTYKLMGLANEAADYFQRALLYNPGHVSSLNEMGAIFMRNFRFEEAQNYLDSALKLGGEDKNVLCNSAALSIGRGQHMKAVEYCRRGLAFEPAFAPFYHNMMLAMVYAPGVSPQELLAAANEFGTRIAEPLYRPLGYIPDKAPDRKLRIGYVSGDFKKHSVSYFIENLLSHHDRAWFEIYAYSNLARGDVVTDRIRGQFDHWQDIFTLNDERAATLIENDRIDILVDLAGHTDANRLLVFARKPAPVQVTWLGFPATTGVKAIDYRITDPLAEPPGIADALNVEKLWRLPHIFSCYSAGHKDVPVIDHPPLRDNGFVTFGCFNNFTKVSDEVLRTWAQILWAVPQSRLLLEIGGLDSHQIHREVKARIARAGLPQERVIMKPRQPENQFVLYNKIDIALDPFPCNGGTTSMDTLWMGVPLITLAGDHFLSRMGVTILTNAGLPELIAGSLDEYVQKATALANDPARMTAMRQGLREKVMASSVMNQELFARDMEDAYRGMWQDYCRRSDTE
jgi:protein O-GlcNAc transferase